MANEVGAGDHSVVEGMDGGTRRASTMECDAYGLMVIARISSTSEARSPPMRDLSADLLMKYLAISISPETLSLEDERRIIHGEEGGNTRRTPTGECSRELPSLGR